MSHGRAKLRTTASEWAQILDVSAAIFLTSMSLRSQPSKKRHHAANVLARSSPSYPGGQRRLAWTGSQEGRASMCKNGGLHVPASTCTLIIIQRHLTSVEAVDALVSILISPVSAVIRNTRIISLCMRQRLSGRQKRNQ